MAWRQIISNQRSILKSYSEASLLSRFFSKSPSYVVKVGIPEFLTGVGRGVESHVAKLESEIGDFQKLLAHAHLS